MIVSGDAKSHISCRHKKTSLPLHVAKLWNSELQMNTYAYNILFFSFLFCCHAHTFSAALLLEWKTAERLQNLASFTSVLIQYVNSPVGGRPSNDIFRNAYFLKVSCLHFKWKMVKFNYIVIIPHRTFRFFQECCFSLHSCLDALNRCMSTTFWQKWVMNLMCFFP